jgi:catechol 2,3-dioxygenase-like lactoylglutathione lyase family enzyme
MTGSRTLLAIALAAATLVVVVVTVAMGGALHAGLAPWPGIAVALLAVAAFAVSGQRRSWVVAGLLAASGIVAVAYGLMRTELLTAVSFPGPIFGVILGAPILGLAVAEAVGASRHDGRPDHLKPRSSTRRLPREETPMPTIGIRYLTDDVPKAVDFYTTLLGFTVERDASPVFASVVRYGVRLLLSGDGSSGRRPLPDGRLQTPGGWNRIHIEVTDLTAEVERLRAAGVRFRTDGLVTGPGGAQVILDDPSGNPVELFQPARRPA